MNAAEQAFADWAEGEGWRVTKAGWPDFFCFRGNEVMAVEVKWATGLSPAQVETCNLLAAHGIPTYMWMPPPFGAELTPFEITQAGENATVVLMREIERLQGEIVRLEERYRRLKRKKVKWVDPGPAPIRPGQKRASLGLIDRDSLPDSLPPRREEPA